jgi:hypothetical protein
MLQKTSEVKRSHAAQHPDATVVRVTPLMRHVRRNPLASLYCQRTSCKPFFEHLKCIRKATRHRIKQQNNTLLPDSSIDKSMRPAATLGVASKDLKEDERVGFPINYVVLLLSISA